MTLLELVPPIADQRLLTVVEAAIALGKSTGWVRRRITNETLQCVPSTRGTLVTADSVARMKMRIATHGHRPRLTLVVDNS